MWRIVIPTWVPPYLNTARGFHWNKSEKNTQQVADMVATYAMNARVPLVTAYKDKPVRRVTIDVVKYGKLPDPDNLLKHTLDGLKRASLIVDDSQKWCQWERPTLEQLKGKKQPTGWGTVIVIADVAPEPEPPRHPVFTRAQFRGRAKYKGLGVEGDFYLYFDCHGAEEVWLSYTACHRLQFERLKEWVWSLGILCEENPWVEPEDRPKKGSRAVADPDLFCST